MKRIAELYDVEKLNFWGSLLGLKKDYYVVMGMNLRDQKFFPELRFFWSDDLVNFAPLPELDAADRKLFARFNEYLSGEHDKIIHRFQTEPGTGGADLKTLKTAALQKQHLKEIHLVAHLVQTITAQATLVPYEAFRLDFNDTPRVNDRFRLEKGEMSAFCFFERPDAGTISKFKGSLTSAP